MKLNHPSNTTGSFTLPLLYINIQSFKRRQLFCLSKVIKWKKQTKKQKVNPKSMLFYFTGFWACCELISCFFPRKKSNIPGRDMHDWSWKVCLFQGKKNKRNFEKRQKTKGTCMQEGIILIHFQCLITNLLQLISLLCPQLLFFCHQFIFLWKSERHQGWPWKSSGAELVSQMPHYWSRLPACLVVYVLHSNHLFCSDLLCFENNCGTQDSFYHSTVCPAG